MNTLIECQFFRDRITHFQAEEVSADERRKLQDHLDGCADCSARLDFEEGMRRGIIQRLQRVPAPPGLETRIRASLASLAPERGGTAWFRRPWFATVAASALLALLVLAGNGEPRFDRVSGGSVQVVRQHVTVVDRDCERAGRTLSQQRNCRNHKHLNMLKVSSGNYWFLSLDDDAATRILLDPGMRGRRLMVAGNLYPEIRTLRMTDYRAVDLGDQPTPLPVSL